MLETRLIGVFVVDLFEQSFHEKVQVTRSVPQGRQLQIRHGQAIEEVLSESAMSDLSGQAPIRRSDDPYVDLAMGRRPNGHNLSILQDTKKLDLGGRGKFADLVKEQCSVVGGLEIPGPGPVGASEGAFFVTE